MTGDEAERSSTRTAGDEAERSSTRITGDEAGPLAGVRVGVTADRRADDQIDLLHRRGATTRHAATMRIVPLADDTELAATTRALVDAPPAVVVATTGQGFRGWLEVADEWGLGERLRAVLGDATLLARGPKARGAIRGSGLREAWSADATESSPEVLEHLLAGGAGPLVGTRVAVQLHGDPMTSFLAALREAGADVVEVHVYRWEPPPDLPAVDALIAAIVDRELDTVTFTSAPAVEGLLYRAEVVGRAEELLAALRGGPDGAGVLACAVGPVTAAPLDARGVPSIAPDRFRLGAMVRRLEEHVREAAAAEPAR
jgi:uroporphyrinogen-III synthase